MVVFVWCFFLPVAPCFHMFSTSFCEELLWDYLVAFRSFESLNTPGLGIRRVDVAGFLQGFGQLCKGRNCNILQFCTWIDNAWVILRLHGLIQLLLPMSRRRLFSSHPTSLLENPLACEWCSWIFAMIWVELSDFRSWCICWWRVGVLLFVLLSVSRSHLKRSQPYQWHNMTHGARFKVSRRWVPMSAWLVPVFIAWRRHERSEPLWTCHSNDDSVVVICCNQLSWWSITCFLQYSSVAIRPYSPLAAISLSPGASLIFNFCVCGWVWLRISYSFRFLSKAFQYSLSFRIFMAWQCRNQTSLAGQVPVHELMLEVVDTGVNGLPKRPASISRWTTRRILICASGWDCWLEPRHMCGKRCYFYLFLGFDFAKVMT